MKIKILALLLALILLLSLAACAENPTSDDDTSADTSADETLEGLEQIDSNTPYFDAKILEISEADRALVEVIGLGNQQMPIGERLVVNTGIEKSPTLAVGDTIRVIFDGKVALSDPGHILSVYEIKKIS